MDTYLSLAEKLRALVAADSPPSAPTVSAPPSAPVPTPAFPAGAPYGERLRFAAGRPVGNSDDLQRILALPRRTPSEPPAGWEEQFRRPGCGDPRCPFNAGLRPIQRTALYEAKEAGGLLGLIGVGHGKTLISLLAGTVLEADVTVLLVPPQLKAQLLTRDIPHLARHWRIPNLPATEKGCVVYTDTRATLYPVAYSELSSAKKADMLDRLRPSLVVADEAHSVKAVSSARTKRFRRYFKANPSTRLLALSGTLTTRSIKDYAHIAQTALKAGTPLPVSWPVLEEWSWALDANDIVSPPGMLLKLCEGAEDVRAGFRRRLLETPGVVASSAESCDASLVFLERRAKVPDSVNEALRKMREEWVTPGGEYIQEALEFSRYARQIASGLYLRWIWPRGESLALQQEWRAARKEWHREVREYLTHRARPGMDSPLLLAQAAATGKWHAPSWAAWARVRDLARPETEAVWIDDFLVRDAAEWAAKHTGVVWVGHPAFGERLERDHGLAWFGAGDDAGRRLLSEDGSRSIAASIAAHGQGKNMQQWHANLFVNVSSSAKTWEQGLGRTHRQGQTSDQVDAHVYRHTPEMRAALEAARAAAQYVEQSTGQRQKLLAATYTF